MDPLDHRVALPDGLRCAVCEGRVPTDRLRILAWREDLAFLQVDCDGCLSTTLGFVMGGDAGASHDASRPDTTEPAPISSDDVLDMHLFLETWRGDLGPLLASERGRSESSR